PAQERGGALLELLMSGSIPHSDSAEVMLGPLDQRARAGPDHGLELGPIDPHDLDSLADVDGRTQDSAPEVDAEASQGTTLATGDLGDQVGGERDQGHHRGAFEITTLAVRKVQ